MFDELGSATQENDGFELGKDLLATLQEKGVSVIFSSQIQSLATWAVNDLGAICFWMDRDHRLFEGINDGGMGELRQEMGINDLLVKAN